MLGDIVINYKKGNLLDSDCDILVNTVNCVGVMGKGIALDFKKKYPEMYEKYRQNCNNGLIKTGHVWWWDDKDKRIANFPTKQHWRNPSKIEWIREGLDDLCFHLFKSYPTSQTSIAIPPLGCGNGGLNWVHVRPLIEEYIGSLNNLKADVYIPERMLVHCKKEPYDVYIGRPSIWGNPYVIGKDGSREEVIAKYEEYLLNNKSLLDLLPTLMGKVLGCWCYPNPCHGDVILRLLYG